MDFGLANSGDHAINSGKSKLEGESPGPNSFHSWGVSVGYADGRAQFLNESLWFESRRFPKPAHIANNPEPLILPWMGPLSGFEAILMTVDAVAILAFAIWWFRSKPKH